MRDVNPVMYWEVLLDSECFPRARDGSGRPQIGQIWTVRALSVNVSPFRFRCIGVIHFADSRASVFVVLHVDWILYIQYDDSDTAGLEVTRAPFGYVCLVRVKCFVTDST